MNLWVNFGLKFTLFYKGKMAKISPKINKIEILFLISAIASLRKGKSVNTLAKHAYIL